MTPSGFREFRRERLIAGSSVVRHPGHRGPNVTTHKPSETGPAAPQGPPVTPRSTSLLQGCRNLSGCVVLGPYLASVSLSARVDAPRFLPGAVDRDQPYNVYVVFRAMTAASDGLPLEGRSARLLGVRVPDDVKPDEEGRVHPGQGGMSVAPGSIWNVPTHRRPRGMGQGSSGHAEDRVYSVATTEVLSAGLVVRNDPIRPSKHAFVEPQEPTEMTTYEKLLSSTRPLWRQSWP